MNLKRTKTSLTIGIAVFLIMAAIALWNPLQVLQWKISDLFFHSRGASDQITIIAIDDKSLSQEAGLGRFKDWPRSYYAQVLAAINPHKPAAVAFDLDFREASTGMSVLRLQQLLRDYERRIAISPGAGLDWYNLLKKFETHGQAVQLTHPDDVDFQEALNESGQVVLFSNLIFSSGSTDVGEISGVKGIIMPIFKGENIKTGYANFLRDRDSVMRRFTPFVKDTFATAVVSFPVAVAQAFLSGTSTAGNSAAGGAGGVADALAYYAELQDKQVPINYAAKPSLYRTIPFVDALAGRFEPSAISGKIVLIGAVSRILHDYYPTPTSFNPMPGVEIVANAVQQIIEDKPLREQGYFSLFFILLVFSIGASIIWFRLNIRWVGVALAVAIAGWPALAFAMRQGNIVLNVVYPETAMLLTTMAALWYRNKTEFKEKRKLQKAFSHYVSPVVVNELTKNPETLKLGGKRKNISVLFSDIVGFTTLAEKLSPEDTVALLNDYLTVMTETIFEYHGTLDKYQGDAIMALYGAPLDDDHHAVNACHTALAMRKALALLHSKWNSIPELPFKDKLIQLDFRVGISTGPAVVGNVGSEKRFDYTAIGNIVNLGSRLESVNRKYGTHILVDRDTFAVVTDNHNPFLFRKLDTVRVKGKEQETELFEVVSLAETATNELKAMLDDFENGRMLYTQRNFMEAKQYFEAVLDKFPLDGPAQIFRNRCNFYIRKPPSLDWNAIVNLEEK